MGKKRFQYALFLDKDIAFSFYDREEAMEHLRIMLAAEPERQDDMTFMVMRKTVVVMRLNGRELQQWIEDNEL